MYFTCIIIILLYFTSEYADLCDSVGCEADWWSEACSFDHCRIGNILSWRTGHEIFSTVIFSLPLIQEGSCQFLAKECTILNNRLKDQACQVNVWLGKLTSLDMTPSVWLGRKISTQTIIWIYHFFLELCIIFDYFFYILINLVIINLSADAQ